MGSAPSNHARVSHGVEAQKACMSTSSVAALALKEEYGCFVHAAGRRIRCRAQTPIQSAPTQGTLALAERFAANSGLPGADIGSMLSNERGGANGLSSKDTSICSSSSSSWLASPVSTVNGSPVRPWRHRADDVAAMTFRLGANRQASYEALLMRRPMCGLAWQMQRRKIGAEGPATPENQRMVRIDKIKRF